MYNFRNNSQHFSKFVENYESKLKKLDESGPDKEKENHINAHDEKAVTKRNLKEKSENVYYKRTDKLSQILSRKIHARRKRNGNFKVTVKNTFSKYIYN